MLDRRTQPNLFDPARVGGAAVEEEHPRDPGDAEQPWPGIAARPDIRSARLGVRGAGTLLWGRVRDPLRRGRRYVPVAVLLLLVLTHPAGCGRSATTTQVTRTGLASSTLAVPARALAARATSVRTPSARAAGIPTRRVSRSSQVRSRASSEPAALRAAAVVSPAPSASSTPPPSPPSTPPATYTQLSSTGSEPARRQQESGAEFGFER